MTALSFEQFERAYEAVAAAIDRAGPRQETLFLTKLALALAHEAGSVAAVERCIEMALRDLPPDDAAGMAPPR